MRGRPFQMDWRQAARGYGGRAHAGLPAAERRHRAHEAACAVAAAQGKTMGEVADIVGTHRRAVQDWVAWYRSGGLEEVAAHKKGGEGVPRFLNPDQERALTDEVSSGRFRTAAEIRDWIESEYGASYRSGSIYRCSRCSDARAGCRDPVLLRQGQPGRRPGKKRALQPPYHRPT